MTENVGDELNNPEYIKIIMPPLMAKYTSLADGDKELCHIFECLTPIAVNLGLAFGEVAMNVFDRCLRVIQQTLLEYVADAWSTDKEFIICSIDLIAGMAEGLGVCDNDRVFDRL